MKLKITFLTLLMGIFSWQANAQVNVTGSTGKDGSYTTLAAAFTAIGTAQTGNNIVITLSGSTLEPAAGAALLAGTWNSLKIYPIVSGVTITNVTSTNPLIGLNGSDNVTIDGRVNQTGSADMIINKISDGPFTSIAVTKGGTGYTTAPTVNITGGGGSGATATATVSGGIITSYTMPTKGTGYTSLPTITLTPTNGGSGAVATAVLTGSSTINFFNGATNNTIQYCILKGNYTSFGGIVNFGSGGNNNNTIQNNIFTGNAGGRPYYCIASAGTTLIPNNGNNILNNEFKDFQHPNTPTLGIGIGNQASSNNNWTITGNSFYETTSFVPTASSSFIAIQIGFNGATGGSGHTIADNYIGGSAAQCGGAAWTKTSATNTVDNAFTGISLYLDATGTVSTVNNNTIKNISWTNSGSALWKGIEILGGDINIGTTVGNKIGDNTTTGSIVVTEGTALASFTVTGIYISSTGTVNCENNTVGSITAANSNATANTNLYGIYKHTVNGTTTISNNIIGGTIANSLNCTSASTGSAQELLGINCRGLGSNVINNNILANFTNACTGSGSLKGFCVGVAFEGGTVSNNVIHDLINKNASTDNLSGVCSVVGISAKASANLVRNVTGNTIYNLSNDNTAFTGAVAGIGFFNTGTQSLVYTCSGNFIHDLSVNAASTGAKIYGIQLNLGTTTCFNNIVSLGGNSTVQLHGIAEGTALAVNNNTNLYFNTVYIGGVPTSGAVPSYAFYSTSTANTRTLINNLFINSRSGGTGIHYGMTANATNLTRNYNDYLGTISPAKDANSLTIDPKFVIPGGTSAVHYLTGNNVSLVGTPATSITTTDFTTTATRDASTPKIGAFESAADNDIVVNTNTLVAIDNKNVANVTINPGGKLTLNAGKTLNVTTFNIQSDATNGTGTFVDQNANSGLTVVTATVNQSLQHAAALRTWYITPPVATATPTPALSIIRYFDETINTGTASDNWVSSATMVAKKGYQVNPTLAANDISFTGKLNNGNQNITLTSRTGTDNYAGFNLIGNPYPAYLDWSLVTANTANAALMRSNTMWYRTKKLNQSNQLVYQFWTVNGDGVSSPDGANSKIPPMQAFWVRANAGGGTLGLTTAMCSHAPDADMLLKAPSAKNTANTLIRLQVSNGINTDEAVLYFSANSSNGIDAYDAPKMSNKDVTIPEIYTTVGTEKMVINGMNNIPLNTPIGLGFIPGNATSFTFTANEIRNLPIGVKIILKDNITMLETDLTDGISNYKFSPMSTSSDRFNIIFRTAGNTTSVETVRDNSVLAYNSAPQQLSVMCSEILVGSILSVYNSIGQKLMSQKLNSTSTQIGVKFTPGVYMMKVNNLTKKVIVNY